MKQIKDIKYKLGLTDKKWNELNEKLLKVVFLENVNNEKLEMYKFIGDAILKTVVGNILFDECVNSNKFTTEGDLTKYNSKIIDNKNIYCYLKRKEFDIQISSSTNIIKKIIGILYDYLYYHKDVSNSIEIIQEWFYYNFYVNTCESTNL